MALAASQGPRIRRQSARIHAANRRVGLRLCRAGAGGETTRSTRRCFFEEHLDLSLAHLKDDGGQLLVAILKILMFGDKGVRFDGR